MAMDSTVTTRRVPRRAFWRLSFVGRMRVLTAPQTTGSPSTEAAQILQTLDLEAAAGQVAP